MLLKGNFLSFCLVMRLLSCFCLCCKSETIKNGDLVILFCFLFLCLKCALFICVQGASETNVQKKKIQQPKYVILILF